MKEEQLIEILKGLYENAENRQMVSNIHLFGIKYSKDLIGKDLKNIALKATKKESYHSEINKGMNLAILLNQENLLKTNQTYTNKSININIKNIILYGSPGVGKTYNTNKLISLIESEISDKEIFRMIKENKNSESANIDTIRDRIKFVTFHQSFGYEDFIEGFRPNEEGKIELVDGVFKAISNQAQTNLDNASKNKKFDFENFLSEFVSYVESSENFELEKDLIIEISKKSNGDFQSFKLGGRVKHQSLTKEIIKRDFEAFIEGDIATYQEIKPTYESQSPYHGNAPYYFKLYGVMKKFLDTNGEKFQIENVKLKNYYLVIDEINRGNISKIFGELITLIEEDKRDTLEVTLPYSKQPFKIPSNLYIIGTMNSTDKSIALIDIALRRRFTFLKMKPKADLIDYPPAREIFENLNKRIEENYQLGHSYFMKIQDEDDLEFILEYKIKPLLEEYFYGDENSLNEVLELL